MGKQFGGTVMIFGFFTPGPMEIVIICVVSVLLFGSQLPKVARSVGSAIPEFKRGLKGINDEIVDIEEEIKK